MGASRRFTAIDGGRAAEDSLADIRAVVDDYAVPAAEGLKRASDEHDVDAIRAYAYELLSITGTIIAACPRPRRGSRW